MKLKVLILLFVPFMLAACRDDDNPRSRPNFVETSFTDISGELTNDYGEEVLTDRNTLYGISVRLDNLHTYSYGLFDDLSKAVVRRDANQEYWFKLTVVPNGKHYAHKMNKETMETCLQYMMTVNCKTAHSVTPLSTVILLLRVTDSRKIFNHEKVIHTTFT